MCKEINKEAQEEPFINADKVMGNGVLTPLHHGLTEEKCLIGCMQPLMNLL